MKVISIIIALAASFAFAAPALKPAYLQSTEGNGRMPSLFPLSEGESSTVIPETPEEMREGKEKYGKAITSMKTDLEKMLKKHCSGKDVEVADYMFCDHLKEAEKNFNTPMFGQ